MSILGGELIIQLLYSTAKLICNLTSILTVIWCILTVGHCAIYGRDNGIKNRQKSPCEDGEFFKTGEDTQIDKGLKINGAVCGWKN